MSQVQSWSIAGSDGQPIIGNTHVPQGRPLGVVTVAHGFKGYKDYGFIPRLAQSLTDSGFVTLRFNFSHSGMTDRVETFERPDLFERDTWNRQDFDLRAVVNATTAGVLPGAALPLILLGHSRGGVAALLTAGRLARDPECPPLAGVVTIAAPATCNPLSGDEAKRLLEDGFLDSPSARTGQMLRVGRAFLQDQIADPVGHDLPTIIANIQCPILVIHGSDDTTVPCSAAESIAAAASRPTIRLVAGADHVLNTPNPMPDHQAASAQLTEVIQAVTGFCGSVCGGR